MLAETVFESECHYVAHRVTFLVRAKNAISPLFRVIYIAVIARDVEVADYGQVFARRKAGVEIGAQSPKPIEFEVVFFGADFLAVDDV